MFYAETETFINMSQTERCKIFSLTKTASFFVKFQSSESDIFKIPTIHNKK